MPQNTAQLEQYTKRLETALEAAPDPSARFGLVRQQGPVLALAASLLGEVEQSWLWLGRLEEAEHVLELRLSDAVMPATVAAMHRRLIKMEAQDRYQLLRDWTLNGVDRGRIRSFNTLTTDVAPPPEFSRALNERPSKQAFELPRIGSVPHLFSSLSLLVQAAGDAGETLALRQSLQSAKDRGIAGAEIGILLLDFQAENRTADFVQRVRTMLQQIVETETDDKRGQIWPMELLVLAAHCLHRDDLRLDAVRCLALAYERLKSGGDRAVRGCLRRAYFIGLDLEAFASAGGDASSARARSDRVSLTESAAPKHWIAFAVEDGTRHVEEHVVNLNPTWLAHEDHILHAYGTDIDFICFRYPLAGNFRFSFDGQDGGPDAMASGLLWNGLSHRVGGYRSGAIYSLNSPDKTTQLEWPCPFVVHQSAPQFNSLAAEVDQQRTTMLVNGQTMWSEEASAVASNNNELTTVTSPWIGFRCASEFGPLMRNLRVQGKAQIPREVPLLEADLRGWIASWYAESRSPVFADATKPSAEAKPAEQPGSSQSLGGILGGVFSRPSPKPVVNWMFKDGVLVRNKKIESANDKDISSLSRLYYMRPLQNGETVRYEFRSHNGAHLHPSVGRITYIMRDDGISLRWIVSPQLEWTGIRPDNLIVDPVARRGPRPIPLVQNDWNQVTVSIANDLVRITLNGSLVLQRILEPDDGRQFGFMADRDDETLEVRNVVLSGDWPDSLTPEMLDDLAAPSAVPTPWQRKALTASFGDHYLAENVAAVRARGGTMPPIERYEYLRRWVMPSDDRDTFRLSGHFSPLSPAPPVAQYTAEEASRLEAAAKSGVGRVLVGGSLHSAAFDLIEAARQTRQLEDLRRQLISLKPPVDPFDPNHRARLALLALVAIADQSFTEANDYLERLCEVVKSKPIRNPAERWPEMLAIWEAIRHPETYHSVSETLYQYVYRDIHQGPGTGIEVWNRQLLALMGFTRLAEANDRSVHEYYQPLELKQWSAASFDWAYNRGAGMPGARWIAENHGVFQMAGQENDFIYYQSPLRGNFTIDCLTTTFDYRECEVFFNGRWAGPAWGMKHYARGDHRRDYQKIELTRPMATNVDRWFHIRVQAQDGVGRMFANGRLLFEQQLPADGDPWIGARSWHRYHGGIRDVRITGTPEIPDSIVMLHDDRLTGWAEYYDVQNFASLKSWRFEGELLSGLGVQSPENANYERLLRYHRPMLEDGQIEYEFFYQPNVFNVSPALDRLAFLIDQDAVRIHWCTDGAYDRTGLSPRNVTDEPQGQLAAGKIPLVENAWNRLKLDLVGNQVELVLNGQPIFRRMLEPSNMRRFGLFYFPGQMQPRVRNMLWTGQWPKELPKLVDQELADVALLEELDQQADTMQSVLIDFADGVQSPSAFEKRPDAAAPATSVIEPTRDGFQAIQQGTEGNTSRRQALAAFQQFEDDFDIVATFERLQITPPTDPDKFAGINLTVWLDRSQRDRVSFHARCNPSGHLMIGAVMENTLEDGTDRWDPHPFPQETTGGRFRIARRGSKIYYLFANGDNDQFRLYRIVTVSVEPTAPKAIELQTIVTGTGTTSVLWKSLQLRSANITTP